MTGRPGCVAVAERYVSPALVLPTAGAWAGCPWRWPAARYTARGVTPRLAFPPQPAVHSPRSQQPRRRRPAGQESGWHPSTRRRGSRPPHPAPALESTHRAPRVQPATTGRARAAEGSDSGAPQCIPADGSIDSGAALLLRSTPCFRWVKSRPHATRRNHKTGSTNARYLQRTDLFPIASYRSIAPSPPDRGSGALGA